MRVVFNNILPFRGFTAVNIFGVLFMRDREKFVRSLVLHESIHTEQMKELGYIGFYILYFLEWMYRLAFHTKTAYRGISFECEAFDHQNEENYLANRKHYAQWRKR